MSDKENDHNSSDRKERNLKRHELCCLRFSDGTASDRDAATLQRKGIDPQPWVELQKLIRNHFVGVESPDLADSICNTLGLQSITIGSAIGLSEGEISGFSVMDVVSKRLELDFDTNNKTSAVEVFTEEPTKPQIDTVDQAVNTPILDATNVGEQPVESDSNQFEQAIEQDFEQTIEQDTKALDAYSEVQNSEELHGDETFSENMLDDVKSEYASSQQEIIQPLQQGSVDNQENTETATEVPQGHFTVEDISEEEIAPTTSTSDIEKHFFDAQQEHTIPNTSETDNLQTDNLQKTSHIEKVEMANPEEKPEEKQEEKQEAKEKLELNRDEIAELTELEDQMSFGLYLIDERQNPDLSLLIMSQVREEHRLLIGSYDLEEDSLEQLIEDTYKSMTNPPPRSPVLQEPIKPLFDDILQDINQGNDSDASDFESSIADMSTDNENIIDIAGYKNTRPSEPVISISDKIDGEIPLSSQSLEEDSDEDYDSEESEEFMLSLDSAIQIEAIEEREIRDLEAIFEGSRIDIATALRDPSPPSNSEMIRVIMEQVNRVGSIQHQLKLVTEDVDENDSENISLSYEEDFIGDVVVSITDIRPPVTVDINSTSGNKTMLALSGLIAVAAALLLYFFASVPTGNNTNVVGGFELAETDVEIIDIDSDEDFSIMKRDGEPTIIFIHEE